MYCFVSSLTTAQTITDVLQQVEQNNTLLPALREQAAAEKIGNKTGILPQNPEVEFHYLWGNTPKTGDRKDFSATQSFDFPTAYYHKRNLTNSKNRQADLGYQTARNNLLLEAKQNILTWVYYQKRLAESKSRLMNAEEIEKAYRVKYNQGDINLLEYNKAKINLLNISQESNFLQTEQMQVYSELLRLNGGKTLMLPDSYPPAPLPPDIEQCLADAESRYIPLRYLQQEIDINRTQEKLQRSLNLPKISLGYMSEKMLMEQFQGLIVGVSIPLWENKNAFRQKKAQTIASQAIEYDAQNRFRNEIKTLYEKAKQFLQTIAEYQQILQAANNALLLKKAFDTGEISLIEYMTELGTYYETVNYLMEMERNYQLALAELLRWEL
jgi:outer membrane protein TolC